MGTLMEKINSALPAPMARGRQAGPTIKILEQCAQSPCTNVCDLGFFNSVDARLPKLRPYNLDEFERLIVAAHADYPAEKMDALFDSKQRICSCILAATPPGGNDFALPHRGEM